MATKKTKKATATKATTKKAAAKAKAKGNKGKGGILRTPRKKLPKGYAPSESGRDYAIALAKLGVLEGPIGDQELAPELVPIVSAFHAVLAGGRLSGPLPKVIGGSPDNAAELDGLLEKAIVEANGLGQPPGVIVAWV
jgi:hypothetical protein